MPAGACDTHLHLFGPPDRFPITSESVYTLPGALDAELFFQVQDKLGFSRAVVVSAGGYGTNYSLLEERLRQHPDRLRGIILPPRDLSVEEIRRLDKLGVRGIRFISEGRFGHLPTLDEKLAQRVHDAAGWQVHFYPGNDVAKQAQRLRALPNTVVLDHFAGIDVDKGAGQDVIVPLLHLLDSCKVWVKLSGPMRCTRQEPPYAAVMPLAHALVKHSPDRLVWGSDWPHVNMVGRVMPNDGDLVDLFAEWVPDAATRRKILVDNAAKLFGFPS